MKNKLSISVISMKKFLIGIVLALNIIFTSCSRQAIVREFGGSMQVELPAGEELMEVTWKNNDLFYLTRPMSNDYVPTVKIFREKSPYGIIESTIIFVEKR